MHIDTGHRRNNFDALRIAAALMVLVGHAYVLSGRAAQEPVVRYTGLGGFGEIGVSIFFVISGYLVSASWTRRPEWRAYLAARLLRILPALAAATTLCALVLGPAMTRLPLAAYFASPTTWLYPVRNVLLYPVTYVLPGVFEGLPYPQAVNGSLWTLRLEFTCYLLVPLLWLIARGRRWPASLAALAAAAVFVACVLSGPRAPPFAVLAARNGFLFLAGAALYAWRDAVWTHSWKSLAAAAAAFALALACRPCAPILAPLALPLLVIAFARRPLPGISSFSRYGDYSYGVYIYAFPVQQTWMALLGPQRLDVPAFVGLTVLTVAPLAAASWLLVEKPALELKARVRGRA